LQCIDEPISTQGEWRNRRTWLDKLPAYRSFDELDRARAEKGVTLGLLRDQQIESLQIRPARNPAWTTDELAKLSAESAASLTSPAAVMWQTADPECAATARAT
jgi:hypothetical protein